MPRYFDDPEILSAQPQQISEYLLSRGWVLEEQVDDKATVWDLPTAGAEVWLPLRRELRDYGHLIGELFATLQAVEQRSIRSIVQDLSLTWADVSRFRIATDLFATSSLPLSQGVTAVRTARDVISAAARWLQDPRSAYYARPTGKVSQFLRGLRLGQTEVGSYVVTVISPLVIDEAQFARDSMVQVFRSVASVRQAALRANETLSMEPFNVAEGVSANLCDALVSLGEASPDNAVEVNFSWSRRLGGEVRQREFITLDSAVIRTLVPAAEHLREQEPVPEMQITGDVRTLTDRSEEHSQSEVTLLGQIEGRLRSVHFVLRGAERQAAIEAFERRLPVVVVGTLDMSGTPYRMTQVRLVRMLQEGVEVQGPLDFGEPAE